MKFSILSAFIFLWIVLSSFRMQAQTGKEFWFAVPYIDHSHDSNGGDGVQSGPNYFRISTGEAGAIVNFYYFPGGGSSNKKLALTATVASNSIETVYLVKEDYDDSDGVIDTLISVFSHDKDVANYNTVLDKGLYVKSNNPISIYYEIGSYNNTDIFALKGEDALGTDFYPVFQNQMMNANESWATDSWASIDIVSAEDGNEITISGYSPATISLDQGETYSLKNDTRDAVKNIGSIHIVSTGAIAVTGQDGSVKDNNNGAADVIGDQFIPSDNAGSVYIIPDFNTGTTNQEQYAFCRAIEDGTELYNTAGTLLATINAGEIYTFSDFNDDGGYHKIYSNSKDFFCYHIAGFQNDGGEYQTEFGGAILPPVDRCTGSTQSAFNIPQGSGHKIALISRSNTDFYYKASGDAGWTAFSPSFTPVTVGAETWYYSLNLNFAPATDGTNYLVKNSSSTFHLCVLSHVTNSGSHGTFYGYFSDFTEPDLQLGFDTLATGEVQLFAFGGKEGTYEWSLYNPAPASSACADHYFTPGPSCNNANPIVLSADILDLSGMFKYYATGENTCTSPSVLSNYVQFEIIDNSAFFVPLPIELIDFSAESNFGFAVNLEWQTASETNNLQFIVERSHGSDFETVAVVDGAGNSSQHQSYSIKDIVPEPGLYYYRLKQKDVEGAVSISATEAVAVSTIIEDLLIYPTYIDRDQPLIIESQTGSLQDCSVKLYDSSGALLYAGTYTQSNKSIQLELTVPNGNYKLVVEKDGIVSSKTVVYVR